MAKTVTVDVKITTKQAQQNIDELNKSFEAQEDLIESLESDLRKYEKQLGETSGREVARRSKLNDKIKETKTRLAEEKAGIKTINKERKRANQQLKESTKNTADYSGVIQILDRQTGGAISGVQNLTKSVGGATKGFKFLRAAIIATGIGALVLAITSVATAFTNSEAGQNKFRKLMTQIGVVVGNVTDILGNLGNAIISFVTGNFDEAKESINAVTEGIKNFGEETRKEIETAGKLADMRADADKLERKLLLERAEATRKFNELREKAADKENVSVEERIEALKEAGRIEDEITKKEIEAAKLRFEAKKQENALSESTKEDLDEEARLQARVIELEAARLKKQKTLTAEITTNLREAESERKRIEAEKKADQDAADKAEADAEKALADLKKQIRDAEAVTEEEKRNLELTKIDEHYTALIEKAKANNLATDELEEAQRQARLAKQQEYDAQDDQRNKDKEAKEKEHQKNIADAKMAELEAEAQIQQAKMGLAGQFGNLLTQIAGKNKTAAIAGVLIEKAASIGQIISSTGIANAKAVAASPLTAGQPFVAINSISAGLSVASSLAAAQKAISQIKSAGPAPAAGVSGTGGAGGASIPSAQPPSFNIVGSSAENQLAQTIAGQTQKPVKAYVVAGDVTTAQSMDRNIIQESALG